jgi:hypothetical protein
MPTTSRSHADEELSHAGASWALLLALTLLAGCAPEGFDNDGEAAPVDTTAYQITLGPPEFVPDPGVPNYTWFPDGHISVLRSTDGLQMYWAGGSSYRTVGADLEHMTLSPEKALLHEGPSGAFDNGGAWLMSVADLGNGRMVGFYHAEDREWPGHSDTGIIAWKSVARATSDDGGKTWAKQGQVLTSPIEKPTVPTWGGSGDPCVVWDDETERWYCFFQEHVLYMAVSEDPEGRAGTWRKFFRGGFTEPGLGGGNSPIPALQGFRGANPSVLWNDHLERWLMTWHTWEGSLAVAHSEDLIHWQEPKILLPFQANAKNWYPTIIGETDTSAGAEAWLYYAHWPDRDEWQRRFHRRRVTFNRGVGP